MFRKILVPLDRSPLAEEALGAAASIARATDAEIELVLVHQAMPYAGFTDAPWNAAHALEEEKYLGEIADELKSGAAIAVDPIILHGDVVERICERARAGKADLIIMTSHGRTGLARAWLGSVADGVLRKSTLPVLMLRPVEGKTDRRSASPMFKHILVPLDGSAMASAVLPSALDLAKSSNGRLSLLRVVQPVPLAVPDVTGPVMYAAAMQDTAATEYLVSGVERELNEQAQYLAQGGFSDVETNVIVAPHVGQAIIDFAKDNKIDAIAMATRGRGASRLLVGSIADKVIRAGTLPMLLRRPIGVEENAGLVTAEGVEEQLPSLVTA
jgi:nucleotide-binding universal stress UspA family protein